MMILGPQKNTKAKNSTKELPKPTMVTFEPSARRIADGLTDKNPQKEEIDELSSEDESSDNDNEPVAHQANPVIVLDESDDEQPIQRKKIARPSAKKKPIQIVLSDDEDEEEPEVSSKGITPLYQKTQQQVQSELKGIQLKEIKKGQFKLISKVYQDRKDDKATLINFLQNVPGIGEKLANQLLSDDEITSFTVDEYFKVLEMENKGLKTIASGYALKKDFFHPSQNRGLKEELKKANKILWPICSGKVRTSGNHFYLLVLEKTRDGAFNIYCLDGFNSASRKTYMDKGEKLLQALFPDKPLEKLVKSKTAIDIPTQDNAVDCAGVISYWGAKCAKSTRIPVHNKKGTCDYSEYRYDMSETLIANHAKKKLTSRL